MKHSPAYEYYRNVIQAIRTILIGMRISLKYCFSKTVTLQYPDVGPALQPRYRGFHFFEIEKCITCDACAKACPVDCIYIEKSGPRKIDKESGVALGGAVIRYAIDYSKCMFCALCIPPCPTDCIHMGKVHDMSGYTREDMIVEFTELASEGLQTPQPLWMQKRELPEWVNRSKEEWLEFEYSDDKMTGDNAKRRAAMVTALTETEIPKKKKPALKKDA